MGGIPSPLRHPIAFVREKWASHQTGEMNTFDDGHLSDGPD
ncbi:hypothetical protein [Kribbella steppae]|nr:hypothetical protein [Kribbella steppae]